MGGGGLGGGGLGGGDGGSDGVSCVEHTSEYAALRGKHDDTEAA